jgi:molybdopterin/thiamine biosynthesis adenylyltransferase
VTNEEFDGVVLEVESPLIKSIDKHSDKIYNFELQGKNKLWNVRVDCSYGFPFRLPSAKLLNSDVIGSIPHVNFEGIICVEESDSILLDYKRPIDLICYFVEEIIRLLDRSSLKIFRSELTDEYEGYFQSSLPLINSFYEASSILQKVNLRIAFRDNYRLRDAEPLLLYGNDGQLPRQFSNVNSLDEHQNINIIHIPLLKSVLPPQKNQKISSNYILEILHFVSKENNIILQKLLKKEKQNRHFFILISMPRSEGERSQILIRFSSTFPKSHPLILRENHSDFNIDAYLLDRNDKSYLIERGGGDHSLVTKKVSIIGCGSVGSEITLMLAKAGVGEFTLIDYDLLNSDNIYRHRLGGLSLNYSPYNKKVIVKCQSKVRALATLLRADFPYIRVNPKATSYEYLLKDNEFLKSDVVIVAVGSPTLSLKINKTLKKLGLNKAIFCWNEAAGVGGHSVSFDLDKSCYECLYSDDNSFTMNCSLSLLETGQNISKNITGCAGVFTPFSYLDSSQTAILAAKDCISMLLKNKNSQATTWKGDNRSNLKLSERFELISDKESIEVIQQKGCNICNGS